MKKYTKRYLPATEKQNLKQVVFTVTNDLSFDQRMQRICHTLATNGYSVILVGRKNKDSLPLQQKSFHQKRISCFFTKGFLFYAEYNLLLFLYLLLKRMDVVCAIDLDTILPCYIISALRKKKRVYDAHELFCEMKEVVTRPRIYKVWKWIEKRTVPKFYNGYTVNSYIKDILQKEYGVEYTVVRNMPLLVSDETSYPNKEFVIYQGAVNHGRCFEAIIPAFQWIDTPLYIYGTGNFYEEAKKLTLSHKLENKVFLKGPVDPNTLRTITPTSILGINIIENEGLNNYYSLANRFFDYMHAGIPQLCVDYPAYREINQEYKVAVLTKNLSPAGLASEINQLLKNKILQEELKINTLKAREVFNWQNEEKKLLQFYKSILDN